MPPAATRKELYPTPTWALLAGQARVRVGGGATVVVILQLWVELTDAESTTLATKELAPPLPVGVPPIAPVEALRLKTAGSDPVIENI